VQGKKAFDESVRRALDSLPAPIVAKLENVAIVVEDEDPEDPDLFGVCREEPYMPVTIAIYRIPLEDEFPDREELEQEIRITVLHELGHYFGMDERELDDLGYA
jgi:predicted Zn-dependent protease with MMP-like domain